MPHSGNFSFVKNSIIIRSMIKYQVTKRKRFTCHSEKVYGFDFFAIVCQ